jgi:hypothetical protein
MSELDPLDIVTELRQLRVAYAQESDALTKMTARANDLEARNAELEALLLELSDKATGPVKKWLDAALGEKPE